MFEPKPEYLDIWYDKYTTSWVVQLKDIEGNQIGNCDYVYTKKEAKSFIDTYEKEHGELTVRIYKRSNGELE